ncbi:hypothetical protein MSNKSG1_00738 [Marinobacter santoriniensis NKSG1]|uniref:Uncharacterized protein n=1 Tax=Marinobacter santoriniensis NKSG1 TaxID=1288826 RepID=M7CVE4_9GAMM|nr:hypothetical protein [Marinobacter santoriniensis]EMP57104.1 hypothetical protein MSNKSG1_00738 [Marinobacter santoriniensis NKSG1]
MSTRASISGNEKYHLYTEELLSDDPRSVFLDLTPPPSFQVSKEVYGGKMIEQLRAEIPTEVMDEIAIAWIKHRKLQSQLGIEGGPVGAELGSPDNPWE